MIEVVGVAVAGMGVSQREIGIVGVNRERDVLAGRQVSRMAGMA
jgi:hypothetical protein